MIKKFIKSMSYALKGIYIGIKEERNVRIDITAGIYVLWLSSFYNFTRVEWALVLLICFVVPAFEMMNTAVERTVKNPTAERYMIAGEAKDTAAGSVLLAAFGAVCAGAFLFGDLEIIKQIIQYFTTDILHIIILILSILCAYYFITIDKFSDKRNRKKG